MKGALLQDIPVKQLGHCQKSAQQPHTKQSWITRGHYLQGMPGAVKGALLKDIPVNDQGTV